MKSWTPLANPQNVTIQGDEVGFCGRPPWPRVRPARPGPARCQQPQPRCRGPCSRRCRRRLRRGCFSCVPRREGLAAALQAFSRPPFLAAAVGLAAGLRLLPRAAIPRRRTRPFSPPHTAFLAATLPRNRSSSRPIPSAAICATISSPRPSSPPLPSSPPPVGCCSSFSPFPFPRRRCFLAAIAFLVAAVPVRCPVPAASFVRRHRLPRDPRYLHRRSHTTVPRRRLCPSSSLPLPRFRPRSLPLCDAPAPRSVGPLPDFGLRSSLEGLPRTRLPYLYVDA